MTEQQIDRDELREDAEAHLRYGGGGDDLANGVLALLDQLDQQEAELDSWMTRAYEAEGKLWKAEARIKAVQHLIDQADEMGEWAITCTRLQWAIDGSAPRPGA